MLQRNSRERPFCGGSLQQLTALGRLERLRNATAVPWLVADPQRSSQPQLSSKLDYGAVQLKFMCIDNESMVFGNLVV